MNAKPAAKRNAAILGIVGHARKLGVSHAWLFMCLTGRAKSPALLQRYNDLVAAERAADPLAAEKELVQVALAKADGLLAALTSARTDSALQIAANALAEIVTPELSAAVRVVPMTTATMIRFGKLFGPLCDVIFQIRRDPANPNRIKIGARSTPTKE